MGKDVGREAALPIWIDSRSSLYTTGAQKRGEKRETGRESTGIGESGREERHSILHRDTHSIGSQRGESGREREEERVQGDEETLAGGAHHSHSSQNYLPPFPLSPSSPRLLRTHCTSTPFVLRFARL